MSITVNAKAYVADGFQSDSVHFQGPSNTTSVKDQLIRKRYAAKPSDAYSGNTQYLLKANRTHTLTGAKTASGEGSAELLFKIPVGISDADRDSYCNDLGAYIASAAFKADLKAGQVNG